MGWLGLVAADEEWIRVQFIIQYIATRGPGVAMTQNRSLFQIDSSSPVPSDFKKERAQYLAERKARKLEAQNIRKQQIGRSSSSEDELPKEPRQPVLIKENYVMEADGKTDSSGSSPPPQETLFRAEREKYKQQREARKQEALRTRKMEFGSSSSSEDQVPLHPLTKIPVIKLQPSPRSPVRQEDLPLNFMSVDLGARQQKEWGSKEGKEGLQATVRLKDKREIKEKFEVQVPSGKFNIWVDRWLEIRENALTLGDRNLPLYDITKAKMIAEPTQAGSLKIKLTLGKEEVYLAAHPKRPHETYQLDQYYFIFARIVALKLQLMGRKPAEAPKVKPPLNEKVLRQARLMGKVRKNSFFGGWEEQIAVVGSSGLAIYKEGREKPTLAVPMGTIREIWTRFQFQRDNIVIKFFNGLSKVELSIPVENFIGRDNWLYQLYSLTPK